MVTDFGFETLRVLASSSCLIGSGFFVWLHVAAARRKTRAMVLEAVYITAYT